MIEFAEQPVKETREIAKEVYMDFDEKGRLVSMTIEHARSAAAIKELSFEEIGANT